MRTFVNKNLPLSWKNVAKGWLGSWAWSRESYSQEGEDLLISRLFENVDKGFYVDIGAHHPFRYSNTYLFYKKGWSGINIDACPGSMTAFNRWRSRDINLELGVSLNPTKTRFYMFNEPALNTFDEAIAVKRAAIANYAIVEVREIECLPLHEILARYLPSAKSKFEFLSVDVEGLDLQVLQSNDWSKFRPSAIVVEALDQSLDETVQNDISMFLAGVGFKPFSKLVHSVIYVEE